MKFRSNEVQGVLVYDYSYVGGTSYQWSEAVTEYHNEGDIIDVDFDVVIETHFTIDFLNGKFTAVDEEAQAWAKPLLELVKQEVVTEA